MKKTLLLILAVIFLSGCTEQAQDRRHKLAKDGYYMNTIVYEGCEYVLFEDNRTTDIKFTHKGNCKFCNK